MKKKFKKVFKIMKHGDKFFLRQDTQIAGFFPWSKPEPISYDYLEIDGSWVNSIFDSHTLLDTKEVAEQRLKELTIGYEEVAPHQT